MRTTTIMATMLWLVISISANAECFRCVDPGATVPMAGTMSVGNFVQLLDTKCGLSGITADRFVEVNRLGNWTDSSAAIMIDSGRVIKIPADAIKAPEKISEDVVVPKANNDVGNFSCENISGVYVPESYPFKMIDYRMPCHFTVGISDQLTLPKVAARFRQPLARLEFFNKVQPNKKLLSGTVIDIPNDFFTYWVKPGAAPVGEKSLETLETKIWPRLQLFQDHPELISVMADKYKNVKGYHALELKSGTQMKQWMSAAFDRRGRLIKDSVVVYNNGVCAYSPNVKVWGNAFYFQVPGTNRIVVIVMPFSCYNWLELMDEGTYTPPSVTITATPIPPAVMVETTPCPPTPCLKAELARPSVDVMSDSWVRHDFPGIGPFSNEGTTSFGELLYFLHALDRYDPYSSSLGLAVEGDGWFGRDTSGTSFKGGQITVWPMAMLNLGSDMWWGIEPIGLGSKVGLMHREPARLNRTYQTNMFLSTAQTLDAFWRDLYLMVWVRGDWAFDANKESYRNGQRTFQSYDNSLKNQIDMSLYDPPENNSAVSAEIRLIFFRQLAVAPLVGFRSSYTFDDGIPKTNEAFTGIATGRERFLLEFGVFNKCSKWRTSDNGVSVMADLTIGYRPGHGNN